MIFLLGLIYFSFLINNFLIFVLFMLLRIFLDFLLLIIFFLIRFIYLIVLLRLIIFWFRRILLDRLFFIWIFGLRFILLNVRFIVFFWILFFFTNFIFKDYLWLILIIYGVSFWIDCWHVKNFYVSLHLNKQHDYCGVLLPYVLLGYWLN